MLEGVKHTKPKALQAYPYLWEMRIDGQAEA